MNPLKNKINYTSYNENAVTIDRVLYGGRDDLRILFERTLEELPDGSEF